MPSRNLEPSIPIKSVLALRFIHSVFDRTEVQYDEAASVVFSMLSEDAINKEAMDELQIHLDKIFYQKWVRFRSSNNDINEQSEKVGEKSNDNKQFAILILQTNEKLKDTQKITEESLVNFIPCNQQILKKWRTVAKEIAELSLNLSLETGINFEEISKILEILKSLRFSSKEINISGSFEGGEIDVYEVATFHEFIDRLLGCLMAIDEMLEIENEKGVKTQNRTVLLQTKDFKVALSNITESLMSIKHYLRVYLEAFHDEITNLQEPEKTLLSLAQCYFDELHWRLKGLVFLINFDTIRDSALQIIISAKALDMEIKKLLNQAFNEGLLMKIKLPEKYNEIKGPHLSEMDFRQKECFSKLLQQLQYYKNYQIELRLDLFQLKRFMNEIPINYFSLLENILWEIGWNLEVVRALKDFYDKSIGIRKNEQHHGRNWRKRQKNKLKQFKKWQSIEALTKLVHYELYQVVLYILLMRINLKKSKFREKI